MLSFEQRSEEEKNAEMDFLKFHCNEMKILAIHDERMNP
jgi:hypothetical protein